jgi:hypothetical protein
MPIKDHQTRLAYYRGYMQRKPAADKAGLPSDPKPERPPRKRALTRQRRREREKAEREAEQERRRRQCEWCGAIPSEHRMVFTDGVHRICEPCARSHIEWFDAERAKRHAGENAD